MASITNSRGTLLLPLELVDHIIDEVISHTADRPSVRRSILRSLCYVCHGFYFSAQPRLLSDISLPGFLGDEFVERTTCLMELLKSTDTWSQGIRTMALVFDPPTPQSLTLRNFNAYYEDGNTHFNRETGPQQDYIAKLLDLAVRSPVLEMISFEGHTNLQGSTYTPMWDSLTCEGMQTISAEICAGSLSLKALKFVNIKEFPWTLIPGTPASSLFEELIVIRSSLKIPPRLPSDDGVVILAQAQQAAGRIKTLTLWGISYAIFFSTLRLCLPTLSAGMQHRSPAFYFVHLHTLRLGNPSRYDQYDVELAGKFVMGVSATLEVLELRGNEWTFKDGHTFFLERLLKLKTLKLSLNTAGYNVGCVASRLLSAARLPKLTSIIINMNREMPVPVHLCSEMAPVSEKWKYFELPIVDGWEDVDDVFRLPHFPALHHVSVKLLWYYYVNKHLDGGARYDSEVDLQPSSLFPQASSRPGIQLDNEIRYVYSSTRMSAYLDTLEH